jgi:hypothetical protein
MNLCHKDKVTLRRAYKALVENDRSLDSGLEDPITQHYGEDAADAVYYVHDKTEQRILRDAKMKSRAFGRGRHCNGSRYRLEELVTKFHLVKACPDPWESTPFLADQRGYWDYVLDEAGALPGEAS